MAAADGKTTRPRAKSRARSTGADAGNGNNETPAAPAAGTQPTGGQRKGDGKHGGKGNEAKGKNKGKDKGKDNKGGGKGKPSAKAKGQPTTPPATGLKKMPLVTCPKTKEQKIQCYFYCAGSCQKANDCDFAHVRLLKGDKSTTM